MASVASSTVFASSLPHHRATTRAPPTPPRIPRRARLPGRSVVSCLPKRGSEKLVVTRASDEEGPPEPAGQGRGGGRAWPSLDASSGGLALAAAAGVLMLQGSQQALAGTEFMGMQDVVGDLGDISTGDRTFFIAVYYGVTTLLDAASGDEEKMNEEQEEIVAYIGGSLFLAFAAVTLVEIVNS
uniref:Uncharacterized protein n=1 Tax=Oryza rufipogon TaxID=4529 RepID=A0A0E0MT80_ORYRU